MSLIQVSDLTFSYDTSFHNIFEHASFQLDTDWRLGFTGRNGRGKTTFLKLLMGEYEYRGTISSNVIFEYFPYPIEKIERYAYEIIEEIYPDYEHWQLMKEFSKLGLTEELLYQPFATLSNGEQTKLLLAVLFLKENHFLLIDEPTNHLDIDARKLVAEYLSTKKGFILVSHDRQFLDTCTDHTLSINRTNIEVQKGNFSTWLADMQRKEQFEEAQDKKLRKDIKKLSASAKESSGWSDKVEKTKKGTRTGGLRPDRGFIGHKAAKMMKRSKNLERRRNEALEEKSSLLQNREEIEDLKLFSLAHHANPMISGEGLSVAYGEREIFHNFSFEVRKGERICLRGRNGCGKSSLVKLLLGEKIPYTGKLYLANNLKISYIPQDASFLSGDLKDFACTYGLDESLFKAILRKLGFERIQFEKSMEHYSAGQKKKVLIAKSLCEPAHICIWDEPLNYIDVFSRMQIEQLLLSYEPTLLFVEHDQRFQERIATKIIEM